MELEEFRRALAEAAPGSSADARAARAAVGARARRRRARRWSLASVIGAVTVIAVVTALAVNPGAGPDRVVSVTPSTSTDSRPEPATVSASATQLVAGHWQTLPRAPIPARDQASVVWTGHELIVWGGAAGANDNQLRSDGAAFNPTTQRWRVLPRSPLSARMGQAAVWTGTEMIVWGGIDDLPGDTTGSGAAYNPALNTWRVIAVSPLAARSGAIAVWTGTGMIVLGGDPSTTVRDGGAVSGPGAGGRTFVDGASYDPATDRWQKLATPTPLGGHPLVWDVAAQAGANQLLAWSQWSESHAAGPDTTEESGGADLFRLDETTGRWTDVATAKRALPSIEQVMWTGSEALARGITYNCGVCPGPFVPEVTDRYDPATNAWDRLPPDPLGGDGEPSVWIGDALFSFNAGAELSGTVTGAVNPGDASVYDPAAARWTRLLGAPFGCDDGPAPIWTGQQVLMYCPNQASGAAGLAYVAAPLTVVTNAYTCPSTSTRERPPRAQRIGTAGALVPGAPVFVLACRYHGLNQPQPSGSLAGATVLPASAVARVVDSTPILPPGAPSPNCVEGTGERYVLQFAYRAGPPLTVYVTNDGCIDVDNGDLSGLAPAALTAQLVAALGSDPPA